MSRQLLLGQTLRTGDVVALDEKRDEWFELIVERSDGLALIAPWPASVRRRRSEKRVFAQRLVLVRGASATEHARSVEHFRDRASDFEPCERAALEKMGPHAT